MLDIVTKNHFMQFQGKLMNQTWENDKKPNFGPDFGSFGPDLLAPPQFFWWILPLLHCWKLSVFVILRKAIEPNLSKFSDGRIDG